MRMPKRRYTLQIQFDVIDITATARSAKEARQKIYAKLRRKNIVKLIDRRNTYLDSEKIW